MLPAAFWKIIISIINMTTMNIIIIIIIMITSIGHLERVFSFEGRSKSAHVIVVLQQSRESQVAKKHRMT